MALRKPLVIINGVTQQIPDTDVLNATLAEVDQIALANGETAAVAVGTAVYISAANTFKKAQGNALGTADVLGIVKDASIAAAATGNVQTDGQMSATTAQWDAATGQTGGLAPGATYYLSASTAGLLTVTAPTNSGQYVLKIGKAISTTVLDLSIGTLVGL